MNSAVYRLTFPPSLDESNVVAVLSGLASDLYRRNNPRPTVLFRLVGLPGYISHQLEIPEGLVSTVLGRLRSALPSVRTELIDDPKPTPVPKMVAELRISNIHRPLRVDRAEATVSALLNALDGLRHGERVELVWLIAGARPARPARQIPAAERGQCSPLDLFVSKPSTWHNENEPVRQERLKQSEALLLAVPRIAVWSAHETRATKIIRRVLSALRSTSAPGVALLPRQLPQFWLKRSFQAKRAPLFEWPVTINAAEAAALIGWPIGSPQVVGLSLSGSHQLPPSNTISCNEDHGVVVADSTFPGSERPLVLADKDRMLHTHVIGPTGVGKSNLLATSILADAEHGHGVIVIDPGRDLVTDVLDRLPKSRHNDVILLDPSDRDFPVGLNPLDLAGRSPDLAVEQLVGVLRSIFSGFWGPRTDDVLRIALLSLVYASTPKLHYTLVDVPTILTDTHFRTQVLKNVSDPLLKAAWASYENVGDAGRAQAIGPVLNKLRAFLLRPALRNILGQSEPKLSIEKVLRERKILLVPLSGGELGEDAASLLGALLVARIWQAAQARSGFRNAQRYPVMLYLDEFQTLLRLPTKIGDVLARARKLGLGLTLAHQHLGQLTSEIRTDVLANARSRVIFQVGVDDSRTLIKQLLQLTPEDLQHLPKYEVVAHLAARGSVVAPATGKTRPLGKSLGYGGRLRRQSQKLYGRPIADVEAELLRRAVPTKNAVSFDDVVVGARPVSDNTGEGLDE